MFSLGSPVMREVVNDARTSAKIPDLTFRMCRTTFATLYGGDPRDLQASLGHSTVDLTMRVYRKPILARAYLLQSIL